MPKSEFWLKFFVEIFGAYGPRLSLNLSSLSSNTLGLSTRSEFFLGRDLILPLVGFLAIWQILPFLRFFGILWTECDELDLLDNTYLQLT